MVRGQSHSTNGAPPESRLDSWKEIAQYLNREVRTVQRWEKHEGLPVHRIHHRFRGSVFALREELDQWLVRRAGADGPSATAAGSAWVGLVRLALPYGGLGLAILSVIFWNHLHFLHFEVLKPRPQQRIITTHLGHEIHPSLSPPGDFVAYSWDGGSGENDDIYIEQIGSGKPLRRTDNPARDYSPSWSPGGESIAFLRSTGASHAEIMLIPPLTGAERLVAAVDPPHWSWGPQLTWSADGQWLITSHKRLPDDTYGLYAIHVSSGEARFVTEPAKDLLGDHSPALSPLGEQVAFVRSVASEVGDIYVVQVDSRISATAQPVRVTEIGAEISGPTWTPSGKRIIFSAGSWPSAELWRTDPFPGARPEVLPLAGEAVYFPRITERHHLVFSRVRASVNIWEVAPEKGQMRKVKFSSSEVDMLPEYLPDGQGVAFTSNRTGYPELWLQDGETPLQLTQFKASHTGDLCWSPDGDRIAFDSTLSGNSDIFVLSVYAGLADRGIIGRTPSTATRLTSHPAADVYPCWSPDGDFLYFSSKRSGSFEIWRVPGDGGTPEQVTQTGGYFLKISAERGSMFFSKWRDPGIWEMNLRTGVTSEITREVVDRFVVRKSGIYYLVPSGVNHEYTIKLRDFATGLTTEVFSDHARLADGWTASRDGRKFLLAKYDVEGADLVLIDAFRCRRLIGLSFLPWEPFQGIFLSNTRIPARTP